MSRIFCIIGQSASGKDTLYREILADRPANLIPIVPATTRPQRVGERNGVDYQFVTMEELRVLEAAERLGYVSNNAAVSLRSGRTRTVAVIVPDVSNPHIAHQVKLIEERLRRARTMLVLTDLTVGEVSAAVGYDNQFYFSGLFSKKHGVSPTGYKKSVERIV